MQKDGKTLGTLALVAGMVGISFSATLNKLAMGAGLHPLWLNTLRLGIAVAVLLPFAWLRRKKSTPHAALTARERGILLLSGVMLAVHFASWSAALQYADSVIAVTIWSTFSLMTVIGSSLLLHEKTPLPALWGLLLAVAGVGICAIGAQGAQRLGIVMALLAAVSQAVYTLCGRTLRKKLDTMPYTTGVYSIALVCLLGCALLLRIPPTGMQARGIGAAAALALICTLGGHSMQNYALRYYKAPTVSASILTEVFTGPLLVYLVFGEMPAVQSLIGGAVILLGVLWYMVYEWKSADKAAPV